MRRFFLRWLAVSCLASLLVIGCSDRTPVGRTDQSTDIAPVIYGADSTAIADAYIVVMKPSATDADADVQDMTTRHGVSARHQYGKVLRGFAATLSAEQVEELRHDRQVAYIEQDQMVAADAIQANPPSWGLDRIDQRSLPDDAAYSYDRTGRGVNVYIIDTGIRFSHREFSGRARAGFDAVVPGGNAEDSNGHGTFVAAVIGGNSYGVAKQADLIAVRVLGPTGSGRTSQVIAGVDWVTRDHRNRPAVANMSLGSKPSQALDDAIRHSIADGVVYCVAAGNDAVDAVNQSPARIAEAITVGASDTLDGMASFSNFGSGVDLFCPGVKITSAWNTSDEATFTASGTSAAAPHVTGVAALLLERYRRTTPGEVQQTLIADATVGRITGLQAGTPNRLLYAGEKREAGR